MNLLVELAIFLPLFSGVVNGVFCKKLGNKIASSIAISSILFSSIVSVCIFIYVAVKKNIIHIIIAKWLDLFVVEMIRWAIYIDQLSAIMFLLVTVVSAVVHLYSLGYMRDDKNLPKFLSYLSLFTFFMLSLIISDNLLQLFFGWEGVGLCSYLLIGYYYQKESANKAAIKAFIVNRTADFAFIIGIILVALYTNSINYESIFKKGEYLASIDVIILGANFTILDVICLLLFIGCMGKSAQIGMHIWLPDAMEGPTPVSALIHAATMVTAGVFLLARCSYLFEYSPFVLTIITIIGSVTCLFAALIAVVQTDIKKIIAYSTCSQLGYMFFACGVSAYQVGIFHLVTHGFFKALLFLSAGSVIHACHEQEIFKIGGIYKKMPITYANFWIGSLAIIGIYPLAGFYSKDLILESAYNAGGVGSFAYVLGIIAAILTAIYSMKIIVITFHGKTRLSKASYDSVHESENIMNIPLFILVAGACFSGMLGYYIFNIDNPYGFFANSIFKLNIDPSEHHLGLFIQNLPMAIGIIGIISGGYLYFNELYLSISHKLGFIFKIVKNKFFFDQLYDTVFVKNIFRVGNFVKYFDLNVIDRMGPRHFGLLTNFIGRIMCRIQTGYIFNYSLYLILFVIICVTYMVISYYLVGGGI